jgi:hypothetical protein
VTVHVQTVTAHKTEGKGPPALSAERADNSQTSLYLDIEIISAVRKGDINRLNRLLAKLTQQKPRKDSSKTHSNNNGAAP